MRIAAGKFKAQCLALSDQVRDSGEEIVITKRGQPVAKLIPVRPPGRKSELVGYMAGTVKELGDIVAPTGEVWDADR